MRYGKARLRHIIFAAADAAMPPIFTSRCRRCQLISLTTDIRDQTYAAYFTRVSYAAPTATLLDAAMPLQRSFRALLRRFRYRC